MIVPIILLVVLSAAYYLAYLFSLAASGLYLSEYEEKKFVESVSEKKREYLTHLLQNPRQVAVTAQIVKSLALSLGTVSLFFLGSKLPLPNLPAYSLGVVFVLGGWLIYFVLVELVAPNVKQERALKVLVSKYVHLKTVMTLTSPLVNTFVEWKGRMASRIDLEERKEEIVERAIESLADSAGIDEPVMEHQERRMIESIFDLSDMEVREIMLPRINIVAIPLPSSFEGVQKTAAHSGYSRFPIYEGDIDNIRGILYVKDLFKRLPLPDSYDLQEIARPPFFVPESKKLDSLLEDFKLQKIHMAIVVDEFGGTAGLVTLEDLLEVIVGDIQDEHDYEEAELVRLADNVFLVSANVSMDDLADKLDLKLEEKEFETVGGYIYDLVGSLPRAGQKVEVDGIRYVVEKIKGQRIEKVKIILPPVKSS